MSLCTLFSLLLLKAYIIYYISSIYIFPLYSSLSLLLLLLCSCTQADKHLPSHMLSATVCFSHLPLPHLGPGQSVLFWIPSLLPSVTIKPTHTPAACSWWRKVCSPPVCLRVRVCVIAFKYVCLCAVSHVCVCLRTNVGVHGFRCSWYNFEHVRNDCRLSLCCRWKSKLYLENRVKRSNQR